MGKYVNGIGTSFQEKCLNIEFKLGGVKDSGEVFKENMICVVDNGFFAAAGYAYNEQEWKEFKYDDGRPRQWYILDNAKELAQ
jgi:hypothetical protein